MFENSNREVGQFSLPIYGANLLKGKSAAEAADIKLKELKNGRLAMIGEFILCYNLLILRLFY